MTPNRGALPRGIEAVLLDLDDTLVDASGAWSAAMARTLAPCYERFPQLQDVAPIGLMYDQVLWPLAAERGAEAGGEWDDEFLRYAFRRMLADHTTADARYADELLSQYARERERDTYELFPDAEPALEILRGRYALGLVTNGPSEHQRSRIGPLGLDGYFEAIAVSGELGVRKPDPAIFEHVLRELGVHAGAAVHVGDRLDADVAGAQAAGVAAVWINRDGAPADGEHVPDAEISSLAELPGLLESAER